MPQCIYCGQEAPSGSIAHVTCERDDRVALARAQASRPPPMCACGKQLRPTRWHHLGYAVEYTCENHPTPGERAY